MTYIAYSTASANWISRGATRYTGCKPTVLCGRKVWIAERGGYGHSLKEIWVHVSPWTAAVEYLKGSSLTEGTPEDNRKYLESLVGETLGRLKPLSRTLTATWDAETVEEFGGEEG